jgi:hypothetical protein
MQFISPKNEYPRYYGDIQLEHPNWQLGDALPEGWILVEEAETVPTPLENETVEELFPVSKNGKFFRSFKVRALTAEEIERKNAPKTAKQKLLNLGLTEEEIRLITNHTIW